MEFLIDTANLEDIKKYEEIIPLAGVTSNPSIVKKEGQIDFFKHMKKIREIIGFDRSLHVQVVGTSFEGIMEDAQAILGNIDADVYIKIPVNKDGLRAIKALKSQNYNVTATAIYTKFQAYLAIAAGADYVAPYFNRMENLNIDSCEVVSEIAKEIERTHSCTKVLGASYKNVGQVNATLEAGAQAATMDVGIINSALEMPSIAKAVSDFTGDWEASFGEGSVISDLASKEKIMAEEVL